MNVGNQAITYWAPSGSQDRYGKPNLAAPTALVGRWEDEQRTVVNHKGEDVVSKARIFFADQVIDVDGWLYLGTSVVVDPASVAGASQVLAVSRTPDLSNMEALTTVYLR